MPNVWWHPSSLTIYNDNSKQPWRLIRVSERKNRKSQITTTHFVSSLWMKKCQQHWENRAVQRSQRKPKPPQSYKSFTQLRIDNINVVTLSQTQIKSNRLSQQICCEFFIGGETSTFLKQSTGITTSESMNLRLYTYLYVYNTEFPIFFFLVTLTQSFDTIFNQFSLATIHVKHFTWPTITKHICILP